MEAATQSDRLSTSVNKQPMEPRINRITMSQRQWSCRRGTDNGLRFEGLDIDSLSIYIYILYGTYNLPYKHFTSKLQLTNLDIDYDADASHLPIAGMEGDMSWCLIQPMGVLASWH